MNPRVTNVRAKAGYRLEITFSNGEVGIYDCQPLLGFGVFKELKDESYFRQARAADGTIVWPNEQDICPDTLYLDSAKPKRQRLSKNRSLKTVRRRRLSLV
jgi:hypothetical protein